MTKPIQEQIVDLFKSYRFKRLKQLRESDDELPEHSMLAEAQAIYDLVARDIREACPTEPHPRSPKDTEGASPASGSCFSDCHDQGAAMTEMVDPAWTPKYSGDSPGIRMDDVVAVTPSPRIAH